MPPIAVDDCHGPEACPHVHAARVDATIQLLVRSASAERTAQTTAIQAALSSLGDRIDSRLAAQTRQIGGLLLVVVLVLGGLAGLRSAGTALESLLGAAEAGDAYLSISGGPSVVQP